MQFLSQETTSPKAEEQAIKIRLHAVGMMASSHSLHLPQKALWQTMGPQLLPILAFMDAVQDFRTMLMEEVLKQLFKEKETLKLLLNISFPSRNGLQICLCNLLVPCLLSSNGLARQCPQTHFSGKSLNYLLLVQVY